MEIRRDNTRGEEATGVPDRNHMVAEKRDIGKLVDTRDRKTQCLCGVQEYDIQVKKGKA